MGSLFISAVVALQCGCTSAPSRPASTPGGPFSFCSLHVFHFLPSGNTGFLERIWNNESFSIRSRWVSVACSGPVTRSSIHSRSEHSWASDGCTVPLGCAFHGAEGGVVWPFRNGLWAQQELCHHLAINHTLHSCAATLSHLKLSFII